MFEERELRANNFWRNFDAQVLQNGQQKIFVGYENVCLWIIFIWALRKPLALESIRWDIDLPNYVVQSWWSRVLKDLQFPLGVYVPDFPGSFGSDGAGDASVPRWAILNAFRACDSMLHPEDEVVELFDYRFIRMAERTTGVPFLLSHFSACLVNAIAEPDDVLVDMFSTTGELFATSDRERWRRSDADDPRYFVSRVEELDVELRMRLVLHGKNPHSYQEWNPSLVSRAVLRIDPPSQKKQLTNHAGNQFGKISSASLYLSRMYDYIDTYLTVVVVNSNEAENRGDTFLEIRRRLVKENSLLAVIDFPVFPNVRRKRSVWVIDGRKRSMRPSALMIDLSSLGTVKSQQDTGSLAEFAGRLVRMFQGQRVSARWATSSREDSSASFRHTFDREFVDGYRDVPGLCREVSLNEVWDSDCSLRAAHYLQQADQIGEISAIPVAPLVNLLMSESRGGRTVYLIGNNGEGKSLLLRNVARAFCEDLRSTIGISCSASDRFPLPDERVVGFRSFRYEGARTSGNGANHGRIASDICQKFLRIHSSQEHLRIFSELLDILEFDAKRYIMPLNASSAVISRSRLLESTIALTDDAHLNQTAIQAISTKNYQIALMRSESRGGITPYRDLSSGEQQIIGLVVKVLANAEQGCLMLIDEPEISLHVSWQRVLPSILSKVAMAFGCDILVATHSPLIIASAHEDSSYCFAARQRNLVRLRPDDRRTVEGVLFNGFETYTFNNRMVHERCATIVADAVSLFNKPVLTQEQLRPMLKELVQMRRTVMRGYSYSGDDSVSRSLELISKAREAIQKLEELHPKNISEMPRGYE